MKSLLLKLVWVSFFAACAAPSLGQVPTPAAKNDYIQVMNLDEPILAVHYPWSQHERPCVEVRLLDETPEAADARPMFFVKEYMKGTNLVAIYRCEELSEGLPASTNLTEGPVNFVVQGRRNLLGRPSVMVRCRSTEPGPRYGVRAVFCLLDAWAIDGKLLYLELPQEDFGQRGRIEVIFCRGGDVLWREKTDWPGYKATEKPGAVSKPEAEKPETKPASGKQGK